ncbi:MAG: DUF3343 domain-containing protein [Thermodesulfobacterium sp.]|nr:DUF3343 domain-containing protein [Thermodesulfobacterium sp.]
MKVLEKIKNILLKFEKIKTFSSDRGLLIFENTSEVIRADKILKENNFKVRVVAPPASVRKGCDLAIEVFIIEVMEIIKTLEKFQVAPLEVLPLSDETLKPVDIFHIKDFGDYLMVRAANMKITFHKKTLEIVNISGGGCPDVPYLASKLIGSKLNSSPEPKELGHTLCGYALQLAYQKAKELLCWES